MWILRRVTPCLSVCSTGYCTDLAGLPVFSFQRYPGQAACSDGLISTSDLTSVYSGCAAMSNIGLRPP